MKEITTDKALIFSATLLIIYTIICIIQEFMGIVPDSTLTTCFLLHLEWQKAVSVLQSILTRRSERTRQMVDLTLVLEFIFVFLFICWVLSKGGNDDDNNG